MNNKNLLLLGGLGVIAYLLYKGTGRSASQQGYSADAVPPDSPAMPEVAVTSQTPQGDAVTKMVKLTTPVNDIKLVNDILQRKVTVNTGASQIQKPVRIAENTMQGVSRLGNGQVVRLTVTSKPKQASKARYF